MRARRPRGQSGVIAGSDGLVVAMLILLGGSLATISVWATIDTRTALDAAAREYLRSYTHQSDPVAAAAAGERAARDVLTGRGTPLPGLAIDGPDPSTFGPCAVAELSLRAPVRASSVPFVGRLTPADVTVRHSELIDPHRSMTHGDRYDPASTPCGGA